MNINLGEIALEYILKYGSIVFIGAIIFGNIQGFSYQVTSFLRKIFGSYLINFVSKDFLLLFFTEFIGVIFLLTLTL